MLHTIIRNHKGTPTVMVEGRPLPPMTFCSRHYTNPSYLRRLRENGVRVFFIFTKIEWLEAGAFAKLLVDARTILDAAPDAYLVMRVNIDAPESWCKANPGEVIQFQDGTLHGQYSFSSRAWQRKVCDELTRFIDKVEGSFIGKRNIGYFLNAGGTEEWYVPKTYSFLDHCVGFCKPFGDYYRRWLKKKYASDAALRAAWNPRNPRTSRVSIDRPLIPPLEDRVLSRTDREHNVGRVEHQLDVGALLDPDVHQYLSDFYEAWNDATADALIRIAGHIKKKTRGRQIVGAFYGAMGCVMYHEWGTSSLARVMNSGVVDFLSAPSNYENRFPPGSSSFTNPIDSLRAHNMVWFNEEDDRTHLAGEDYSRALDVGSSVAIMQRNAGKVLCEDAQSWWFENSRTFEWWDHPELMSVLGRIQELARYQWGRPRTKVAQIAFVYSQESIWCTDQETLKDIFQFNRMFELPRIGAPADHILVDDLADKQFQNYKLYVFMNTVNLSGRQRKLIDRVVKRDGKAAIWVHASGMIDPGATPGATPGVTPGAKRLSLRHAEELTGFKLRMYPMSIEGAFTIVPEVHPATVTLAAEQSAARPMGLYEQAVDALEAYNNPHGTPFRPTRVNPIIAPNDPRSITLGRYTYFQAWTKAAAANALAIKPMDGWTSIYWGPKVLTARVLRALANYVGVHIYNWADDVLYANRDFVCVHAYTGGVKRIILPAAADVADAFARTEVGRGLRHFDVTMAAGQTRMFSLHGVV